MKKPDPAREMTRRGAAVRGRVAHSVGLEVDYLRPSEIIERYETLMDAKLRKQKSLIQA